MYYAHFTGTSDKPGFRGLGVLVRGMSPDALALSAVQEFREAGFVGVIAQQAMAELIFKQFNPVNVPGSQNVVTPGVDVPLWGTVQAVKNGLQDLVKNGLNDGLFHRCMRNGEPAGDRRAFGYFVCPIDEELDIRDAWSLVTE